MKGTGFRTTDEGFNKTPSGNHPDQEKAIGLIREAEGCLDNWCTEHERAGCDDECCHHMEGDALATMLNLIARRLEEITEPFPRIKETPSVEEPEPLIRPAQ